MTKCNICEREMLEANGCMDKNFTIDGKVYQALRYSVDETLFEKYNIPYDEKTHRCDDCGCKVGEFHHTGCDMEKCPSCGGQFIFCDCDISDEIILYPRGRKHGQVSENH